MTAVQVKIAATGDDGTENVGSTFFTSIVLAGYSSIDGEYNVFFRFLSVSVPQGATIDSATLTLNVTSVVGTPNTTLYGVDVDDAPAFSSPGNLPSAATRTTASADPDPAGTGTKVVTITSIVQEIVDRAGWASGNDMAFVIDDNAGSGDHRYLSEDYGAAGTAEAVLDITYTEAGVPFRRTLLGVGF